MATEVTSTLSELRATLRQRLGAAEGAALFWTDAQVDGAVREALRTWNLLTGYWSGRVVIPTTAGACFLSIPTSLGWTSRVEWLGVALVPTSLFALDMMVTGWQSATSGTPKYWVPIAVNLIALSPAPSASNTALVVDGVLATPTLATDDAAVTLDRTLLPVLLAYARHLALFSLGASPWRESLSARVELWTAAGDWNTRLKATDLYTRVLGIVEESAFKGKRRGSPSLGAKAPEPMEAL